MKTMVCVFHPVRPTRFSVTSFSFAFMHPNDTILPKLKFLMFAIPELINPSFQMSVCHQLYLVTSPT